MTRIDIGKLEQLADKMTFLSEDSEDALGKLRQVNNEISYDTDLLLFPQSQSILQNLSDAINDLMVADDMLMSLQRIIEPLSKEYMQLEEQSRKELRQWNNRFDTINTQIKAGQKKEVNRRIQKEAGNEADYRNNH